MLAYVELSPVTTDDAICFGASWLSINVSAAKFPWYTFSEAAVLSEGRAAVVVIVEFETTRNGSE